MATGESSEARLRTLLGDIDSSTDCSSEAWADGFGIVAPDVERYVCVLRAVPDAIILAMRNMAADEGIELLDEGATTLLSLLTRAQRPERVLEIGTGIGYVTVLIARAAPADCTITSVDPDPLRQGHAHAFLERDAVECAVELRLGQPEDVIAGTGGREPATGPWDLVMLTDPELNRQGIVDMVTPFMAEGALLAVPAALRGGRVAYTDANLGSAERAEVDAQRALNRSIAADPRFEDVTLVPVGDGLLLARRGR